MTSVDFASYEISCVCLPLATMLLHLVACVWLFVPIGNVCVFSDLRSSLVCVVCVYFDLLGLRALVCKVKITS